VKVGMLIMAPRDVVDVSTRCICNRGTRLGGCAECTCAYGTPRIEVVYHAYVYIGAVLCVCTIGFML
jgi:hypothetical protein